MMAVDLACPNCRERVQVEDQESLCPQCGTNLQEPEPAGGGTSSEIEQNTEADAFAALHEVDSGADAPDFSGFSMPSDGNADEALPSNGDAESAGLRDIDAAPREGSSERVSTEETPSRVVVQPETEQADDGPALAPRPAAAATGGGVPRRLFLAVVSYAVLATLLLILLVYQVRTRGPHSLESLPDIVPNYRETLPDIEPALNKRGEVIRQIVPEDAGLPAGHTLALGESQRFGNVRITPLKVTREMLEFAHYSGDAERTRPAEGPVLKLWLRFENVSQDQVFAPLDRELLYFRGRTSAENFELRANNFVAARDQKAEGGTVLLYDLVLDGEWDPKGQSLGTAESPRLLRPGEEMTTYIPSQPGGIESLRGDLAWRVHFRKGYHEGSGRGATTLIDVVFESSEIENRAQTPDDQTAPSEA